MQLEEQFYESPSARWRRELPWLRIFRSFRMALDFRKMALAFAGVLIFAAGYALLLKLPFSPAAREIDTAVINPVSPWSDPATTPSTPDPSRQISFRTVVSHPWSVIPRIFDQADIVLKPWRDVLDPAAGIVRRGNTWSDTAWLWTILLWTLVVWAVFGGAIARIAGIEIAGVGAPSLREGVRHSLRFLVSTLGGPLLPLVGIGLFWAIAAVIGLIGLLPGVGPVVVWLSWPVSLACGAFLALILLGIGGSWPLMYCTISVEGSDAFDAMSRAYSYLFGRPWYALFLGAIAVLYGSVVTLFLFSAAGFATDLTLWALASGMGAGPISRLTGPAGVFDVGPWESLVRASLSVMTVLLTAFVYSFFWTVMTVVYFLLRHSEDATPFHSVYWPVKDPEGPALSGAAAAELREAQAAASASSSPAEPATASP